MCYFPSTLLVTQVGAYVCVCVCIYIYIWKLHIIIYMYKIYTFFWLIVTHIYKYMYISYIYTAAAATSLQSCPTLCDPIDGSPPGSAVPGILQARTPEWIAISFSNAWQWKVKVKSLSRVRLLATPLTAAYQAPPSMGFSRQVYWSGVPLPSPIYIYTYIGKCIYHFFSGWS